MKACQNGGVRGCKENRRKYPGEKGRRPDRAETRRQKAKDRAKEREKP